MRAVLVRHVRVRISVRRVLVRHVAVRVVVRRVLVRRILVRGSECTVSPCVAHHMCNVLMRVIRMGVRMRGVSMRNIVVSIAVRDVRVPSTSPNPSRVVLSSSERPTTPSNQYAVVSAAQAAIRLRGCCDRPSGR